MSPYRELPSAINHNNMYITETYDVGIIHASIIDSDDCKYKIIITGVYPDSEQFSSINHMKNCEKSFCRHAAKFSTSPLRDEIKTAEKVFSSLIRESYGQGFLDIENESLLIPFSKIKKIIYTKVPFKKTWNIVDRHVDFKVK